MRGWMRVERREERGNDFTTLKQKALLTLRERGEKGKAVCCV